MMIITMVTYSSKTMCSKWELRVRKLRTISYFSPAFSPPLVFPALPSLRLRESRVVTQETFRVLVLAYFIKKTGFLKWVS